MNSIQKMSRTLQSSSLLFIGAFIAGVLTTAVLSYRLLPVHFPLPSPIIRATEASQKTLVPLASPALSSTKTSGYREVSDSVTSIDADAAKVLSTDKDLLKDTLDLIVGSAGSTPSLKKIFTLPINGDDAELKAANIDWFAWSRLNSERIKIIQSGISDENINLYATRSSEGVTLSLINKTKEPLTARLKIHLQRGIYKFEKLTFTPSEMVAHSDSTVRLSNFQQSLTNGIQAHLTYLEGEDVISQKTASRTIILAPGQVCLLRCTDQAFLSRAAGNEISSQLKVMALSYPGPASRIKSILNEASSDLSSLSSSTRHGRDGRLSDIHHYLLLLAQAHSLQRNFLDRHIVSAKSGTGVMRGLEHMNHSIGEVSATLMGLVPQIAFRRDSAEGNANLAPENGIDGKESPNSVNAPKNSGTITITLTNGGSRSAELVKIGLDIAALPVGVTSLPDDPAMFGSLPPGQTAQATYHIKWNDSVAFHDDLCIGDITYFRAGTPVHIHPHPW